MLGCIARHPLRGDSDVTVLVVRDSESEWVVTGAAVAAAITGGCVCDL
jgi:hypothetical protein